MNNITKKISASYSHSTIIDSEEIIELIKDAAKKQTIFNSSPYSGEDYIICYNESCENLQQKYKSILSRDMAIVNFVQTKNIPNSWSDDEETAALFYDITLYVINSDGTLKSIDISGDEIETILNKIKWTDLLNNKKYYELLERENEIIFDFMNKFRFLCDFEEKYCEPLYFGEEKLKFEKFAFNEIYPETIRRFEGEHFVLLKLKYNLDDKMFLCYVKNGDLEIHKIWKDSDKIEILKNIIYLM